MRGEGEREKHGFPNEGASSMTARVFGACFDEPGDHLHKALASGLLHTSGGGLHNPSSQAGLAWGGEQRACWGGGALQDGQAMSWDLLQGEFPCTMRV